MAKPKLLDLCCCQGGASHGYALAGFDVHGIDNMRQPRYPYRFTRADALEYVEKHGHKYDVIVASFPCQGYGNTQRIMDSQHPRLIPQGRELLKATGKPYVLENVLGAPLIDPMMLCGTMFGLNTYRHRIFESNMPLKSVPHRRHTSSTIKMGRALVPGQFYHAVGNFSGVAYVRKNMGVPWMNRDGIRECIPPAYTHFIGAQLMTML